MGQKQSLFEGSPISSGNAFHMLSCNLSLYPWHHIVLLSGTSLLVVFAFFWLFWLSLTVSALDLTKILYIAGWYSCQ